MPAVEHLGIVVALRQTGGLHDNAAHHAAQRIVPRPPDVTGAGARLCLLAILLVDQNDVAIVLGTVLFQAVLVHFVATLDVVGDHTAGLDQHYEVF
ncbi:hypothetical protein D3C73_1280110 [compost metagenome]